MTAQMSDRLHCEYPGLTLDGLFLYGVIVGKDPLANSGWGDDMYPYKAKEMIDDVIT